MNIIFLISDTFRYDNLFDRADLPVETPCLDAFSRRAVSVDRMYTGSFPTIPHRTDLTSGRVGWPWYGWQNLPASTPNNIPDLLRDQGYVSQLLCDCPHLFNSDFQHNFDGALAIRGQESDLPFLRMNHPIEESMPPEKTRTGSHFQGRNLTDLHGWENRNWQLEEDRFPPRTARKTVEWLEQNYKYESFFLWADFFDPHEPWDAPEYMVRKYDADYDGAPMVHPNYGRATDLTDTELRNLHAHYCAEAELVDRWVGRVLQKIDDLQLWDNSVVVFTSDHGISLGEHNRTGKSNINEWDDRSWPLYPDLAHVPCMIAAPGLEGGKSLDIIAQPYDILPTVADLADVDLNPPEPIHGKSFAAHLDGTASGSFRDEAVCASHIPADQNDIPREGMMPVLYTDQYAYVPVRPEGDAELYDLEDDPKAENNIAQDRPNVLREMRDRLRSYLEEISAPDALVDKLCG